MSRIFRCYDADTGESELEAYPVPEGLSLGVWLRDVDEGCTIIIPPAKALELAAYLAARFAGPVPPGIVADLRAADGGTP